jgi:hypothetical protein
VRLDGERALWVSDDGRWQWDAKTQSWVSRSSEGPNSLKSSVSHKTAELDVGPADGPAPASDEHAGLDAGLGLARMWSPPDGKPARRPRVAWPASASSRRIRLLAVGIGAVILAGTALALAFGPGNGATRSDPATPAPAHAYSTQAQESYLRKCRADPGGSEALCGCSLARFQARYSQDEFVALQARFAAQDPTAQQQFAAIAAACIPH